MNNSGIVKKLILIVFIALILRFFINIFLGEYNIFNYLDKKRKIDTLNMQLKKQIKIKEKLLYEVNLLKNDKVINIDILEKESVKKLNRIPQSYLIISE